MKKRTLGPFLPSSLCFRMRKPGTDADDVQMSDVLCDFCRRPWTMDVPMI